MSVTSQCNVTRRIDPGCSGHQTIKDSLPIFNPCSKSLAKRGVHLHLTVNNKDEKYRDASPDYHLRQQVVISESFIKVILTTRRVVVHPHKTRAAVPYGNKVKTLGNGVWPYNYAHTWNL